MGDTKVIGPAAAREMLADIAFTTEEFARDPWKSPTSASILPANSSKHRDNFITQIQKDDPVKGAKWGIHPGLGGSAWHSFMYPPHDQNPKNILWNHVDGGAKKDFGECRIYAPNRVYTASQTPLKVSVLFCPDDFADSRVGVRGLLRDVSTSRRVLVTLPSLYPGGARYGWPATDFVIKTLLQNINLGDQPFEVDVLAAYSAGHRGLHLTLLNLGHLSSLANEPTLIYFDNIYQLHDGRRNPTTVKALTDFKALKSGARVAIYAGTPDGLNPNTQSIKDQIAQLFNGNTYFVDMRPSGSTAGQNMNLMMLSYARIFQAAQLEGFFSSPPAPSASLVQSLPLRGTLLSSPTSSRPPWIPASVWQGTTLSDWGTQHRAEVAACYAKQQEWWKTYLVDHTNDKKVRNYRLVGFNPTDNQLVVHDGLVQEFAVELLLR